VPIIRACAQCGQKNRIPAKHLSDAGRCGNCKASLPPVESPLEVDAEQFDEIVQNAKVPVLADFWAAWCGPCRIAAPEVERTAKNMAGKAIVIKVDTERHPQVAAQFSIRGIPTFIVFSAGKPVIQQAGVVDHQQLEGWIRSAVPAAA
jgi:thioredoxin 2